MIFLIPISRIIRPLYGYSMRNLSSENVNKHWLRESKNKKPEPWAAFRKWFEKHIVKLNVGGTIVFFITIYTLVSSINKSYEELGLENEIHYDYDKDNDDNKQLGLDQIDNQVDNYRPVDFHEKVDSNLVNF